MSSYHSHAMPHSVSPRPTRWTPLTARVGRGVTVGPGSYGSGVGVADGKTAVGVFVGSWGKTVAVGVELAFWGVLDGSGALVAVTRTGVLVAGPGAGG